MYRQEVLREYRARRDAMVSKVKARIEGARFVEPKAGLYLFIDLPLNGIDADRFAALFSSRYGVTVAPGTAFSMTYTRAVRLTFVTLTPEQIGEGANRMARAMSDLQALPPPASP
jgi:aspartate/methionine/tyrosine aminotransferase